VTAVGRRVKRLANTYASYCEIHYRRLAEHENHGKIIIGISRFFILQFEASPHVCREHLLGLRRSVVRSPSPLCRIYLAHAESIIQNPRMIKSAPAPVLT